MKIICAETVISKPHLETSGEIALRFKENKNNIVKFAYLGRNLLWNDWQLPLFLKCLGLSYNKRISAFNEILIKNGVEILNDDKFDNFNKGLVSRKDYLRALNSCVEISKIPTIVQVSAFADLPTSEEINSYSLNV
jgi:hypothetical protein